MKPSDVERSEPRSLADMMGAGVSESALWEPDELAAIFEHQLAAPIEFDLSYAAEAPLPRLDALRCAQHPPIESFGDLFHHPRPPVELLELTKQFAKSCRRRADSPLGDEIATVLYTLSIVVAATKCNRRITKADDDTLRLGVEWALDQPWLDESTRGLLEAWTPGP